MELKVEIHLQINRKTITNHFGAVGSGATVYVKYIRKNQIPG